VTWARRLVAAWPWFLALLVTAPLLRPGFVLSYDMVFVPRQNVLPTALGLAGPLPRAVPADAVVALLTGLVPGQVVQKLVLVGLLGLGGWGAARLVPGSAVVPRLAAASWFVWNPFVAERLVIGHWALLVGYATLPWLVRAAVDIRRGEPQATLRLVALLVPAALVPSSGLVAALAVVPVLGWRAGRRERRALGIFAAAWFILNAPWWLPGSLHLGGGSSSAGVASFAPRAEGSIGAMGSLLGGGGIWNLEVVPTSRALVLGTVGSLAILVVSLLGLPGLARRMGSAGVGLLLGAAVSLVVASAALTPWGADLLRWVVVQVPGGGLLRDGQKYLAVFVVAQALAFGLGCLVLTRRLAGPAVAILGAVLVLLPLAVLPDLAWGAAGRLAPVSYPSDWQGVRQTLIDNPEGGDVVALPWQPFRVFSWNGDRVMLDPAPRWLDRTVVVDDTLLVGDVTIAGDDPRAAAVGAALRSGDPAVDTLPALGVGWLLVEQGTPGTVPDDLLRGARVAFRGSDLVLYSLGPATPRPLPQWAPVVIAVDLLAAATAIGALVVLGWASTRHRPVHTGRFRTANRPDEGEYP
jgi:hypothetical protein